MPDIMIYNFMQLLESDVSCFNPRDMYFALYKRQFNVLNFFRWSFACWRDSLILLLNASNFQLSELK